MTQSDLQKLSEEATQGPWGCADEHGNWPGARPAWCVSRYSEDEKKWLFDLAYMAQDSPQDEKNAAFIVALVNAFREGRLVEAPAKQTCSHGNSPHCYPFCYEPAQEETQ